MFADLYEAEDDHVRKRTEDTATYDPPGQGEEASMRGSQEQKVDVGGHLEGEFVFCLLPPSCHLTPDSFLLLPASCLFFLPRSSFPPFSCLLSPASWLLSPAGCLLPAAFFLLPPASGFLHSLSGLTISLPHHYPAPALPQQSRDPSLAECQPSLYES